MDPLDTYMASLKLPSGQNLETVTQEGGLHGARSLTIHKGSSVVVKNRRYRRLKQLLKSTTEDDHYFSDRMMQQRNPALFHFYLGQYLGLHEDTTSAMEREGQQFSSFLLDTCQRKEMEVRRLKEQKMWESFNAVNERQEQKRIEKLYEDDIVEEEEEEDTTLLSVDERRQQLIDIMSLNFLAGNDSCYVSYEAIDADESLDDYDEINRDAEDKYFAEDNVY
ncbi:hypothetical protein CCR75_000570 [Bremia lactucae]|uniref:CCD97-like C-terminal domain-containing protein n=1 Tax=Bremia lactucae TaxID=4779 RepID=A0A976IJ98_BRELC|nr:hypothetical protein CCR75_000570 [Bremia lactucae]